MNNKDELLSLLEGLSPEKIALLKKELHLKEGLNKTKEKGRRIHKDRHGSVSTFNQVEVHVTCSTCGSLSIIRRKTEDAFVSKGHEIKIFKKTTSHCPYCKDFIKTLSREALEERYLSLLKHAYFI